MNCDRCKIDCHQVVLNYLGNVAGASLLYEEFGSLFRGMIKKGLFDCFQQEKGDCENELWAKILETQPHWLKMPLDWVSRKNLSAVDGTPPTKAKGICDYLRITASNHITDWNRASRSPIRPLPLPPDLKVDPIDEAELAEKVRAVRECVASFSDEYQKLFWLWHSEELPWDRLMVECGYNCQGTLANRLRQLKVMLTRGLKQKGFGID